MKGERDKKTQKSNKHKTLIRRVSPIIRGMKANEGSIKRTERIKNFGDIVDIKER